jgi:hypothetical protein
MARRKGQDSAHVTIGIEVSEADAAGIDEVLTRPEFAAWTRSEWCREIIRSALRFYVGDARVPDADRARASARLATPPPAPSRQPVPAAASAPATGSMSSPAIEPAAGRAGASGPVLPDGGEPRPGRRDAPGQPAQPECSHPANARDYDTGTCGACGAILWD